MASCIFSTANAQCLGGCFSGPSDLLVTVKADGATMHSTKDSAALSSYPVGLSSKLDFVCPAVSNPTAGTLHAVIGEPKSNDAFLVSCQLAKKGAKASTFKTLADVNPRIPLPAKLHSLHTLYTEGEAGCVAAVLQDGRIGWGSSSTEATAVQLVGGLPLQARLHAASSSGLVLALLYTSKSSVTYISVYRYSPSTASLAAHCNIPLTGQDREKKRCLPIALALSSSYALVTWPNGVVSIVNGLGPDPAQPAADSSAAVVIRSQVDVQVSTELMSSHISKAAEAAVFTPQKRKGAATPAPPSTGSPCSMSCCPLDATQFIVACADLPSLQMLYSLFDSKFGVQVSKGSMPLELSAADGAASPVFELSSCQAATGQVLVRLNSKIMVMQVPTQPANLLALVGRLNLGANSLPMVSTRAEVLPVEPVPVAPLPYATGKTLDIAQLCKTHHKHSADYCVAPLAPGAKDSAAGKGLLAELLQAAAAGAPITPDSTEELRKRALEYITSCAKQGEAHLPPMAMLSTTVNLLSEVNAWEDVGTVLKLLPDNSLVGCPNLLPAMCAAQHFTLIAPACCKLDNIHPSDISRALSSLLEPAKASNLVSRRQYYKGLHAKAHATIKMFDGMTARNSKPAAISDALSTAKCAASTVDGFTCSEVVLHPLLATPLDSAEIMACVKPLSNAKVDRLLVYLCKWFDKYTYHLGDGTSTIPIPVELLFPTCAQVIDWLKSTLDAHLGRLLMEPALPPHLEKLQTVVAMQLSACSMLSDLRGAVDHIRSQAPLPAAHIAAATQYTVELLDLKIREA